MAQFVLVHGAWHGGWCWDDVAASLRERGHEVEVVDLPGHDRPGDRSRTWNSAGAYVEAVSSAVGTCVEPPILVGHSMGGYVVQRFLERTSVRKAVLVASVPRHGTLVPYLRAIRRHPAPALMALATADFYRLVGSIDLTRDLFFSPDTPEATVRHTFERLQGESALAIASMTLRRVKPDRVATPVHVIAGRHDQIFTVAEERALAHAYDADLEVLDGGHDLMLDTCWPVLSDALHRLA